jgi:hypothetical protein
MKQRCYNQKNPRYRDYGGRGITICDRWRNSFKNFLADMGTRPSRKHSIDRREVNGNYEPNNCRWVTQDVQINNRRVVRSNKTDGKIYHTLRLSSKQDQLIRAAAEDEGLSINAWSVRLLIRVAKNASPQKERERKLD